MTDIPKIGDFTDSLPTLCNQGFFYLFTHSNDIDIGRVKIERMLTISSAIAECSNVAAVIATRDLTKLDIGGWINMVHQIVFDTNTRAKIEMDYINREFDRIIMEDI